MERAPAITLPGVPTTGLYNIEKIIFPWLT